MKKTLLFAALIGLMTACNKDQSAVKKLDGTWTGTELSVSVLGISVDAIALGGSSEWEFNACKLKDDEFCDASSTFTFPASLGGASWTTDGVFKVEDDGTTLVVQTTDTSTTSTEYEIVELTGKTLVIEFEEAGTTYKGTYEKD